VNGRPVGSRNNRTKEVLDLISSLKLQDPLVTLAQLQANSSDEAIRATAANMLAPYLHSKNATKPVQPDPVYFDTEALPRPANIAEACSNIALLSEKKATGELDVVTADSLIADQRIILNAMVDEAKLLTADASTLPQVIKIEGGLPSIPGCDMIMPQLNGSHLELEAIKDPSLNGPQSHPDDPDKP
jgi:hypothetical protein